MSRKSGKSRKGPAKRSGRQKARELTLQALYGCEVAGDTAEQAIAHMADDPHAEGVDMDYFATLTLGIYTQREKLDEWILRAKANWPLDRVSIVDRNILRLGIFELLEQIDVPERVVFNESIELSKRYGGEESSRFVNGVMDKVAQVIQDEKAAPLRQWEER
uniref:Transcription antitermination protein NusB n=1 Tax=Magnetococcus massalia (strain MO-1) TaxID=451514 RepID=A0A1S7LLL3_MAGMO|nr:antitermination factor [N utilization substance protein B homolog] [Candidatus Magnetococcus massalia]